METIITQIIVLPEFNTLNEGKEFMATYSTPVHYVAGGEIYTASGTISSATEPNETQVKEILNISIERGDINSTSKFLYVEGDYLKYNVESIIE